MADLELSSAQRVTRDYYLLIIARRLLGNGSAELD
jgi:hypothetical protein